MTHRPPIERLVFMAGVLRSGRGLRLGDVATKFEVNLKTVRRDFYFLTDRLRYRVRYSRLQRAWRLDDAPPACL
jgi:hypothetical protein